MMGKATLERMASEGLFKKVPFVDSNKKLVSSADIWGEEHSKQRE